MKKSMLIIAAVVLSLSGLFAQNNQVHLNVLSNAGDPERSYFIVDGKKYIGSYELASWVCESAVCNSEDASFQVLFKSIPNSNKTYKIKSNSTHSYQGQEGEVGIAMLLNGYNDYYGSVDPNKGKGSVKIKNGK